MGKGGEASTGRHLSWKEVQRHREKTDSWIVIEDQVYDVTNWAKIHPGGQRVLGHYAGQDASEAFTAFHPDLKMVKKYLKPIRVGQLVQDNAPDEDIKKDFEELRQTAEKMGLFTPSVPFYVLSMVQLVVLELLAYWILYTFGTGWIPWTISVAVFGILQTQAGWIQHDYGHLSVFKKPWKNHFMHQYVLGFTMGFSKDWWNHLHFQHHAKPNVLHKDPDVRLDAIFVLGDTMPKRKAKSKQRSLPYNWQHRYFFATLPPLLFPVYFQYMNFRHCYLRKKYLDMSMMLAFYVRFFTIIGGFLGLWQSLLYYFLMRVIESHWFVWVSQSNHIPMDIDDDKELPWLSLQLHATCDIEKSWFNDWFTGHLNHQIEHHLFPTMPRHNLYKVAPLCKSLCEKHHVPYYTKPMLRAFADIISSLEHSGQIWSIYYHAYNL